MATDSSATSSRSKNSSLWREHVEGWSASGLSQAEYCRRHGISLSSFYYWKRRFDRRPPSVGERRIVPISFSGSSLSLPSAANPLIVHVGSGFRIEIGGDFCPGILEKLIVALERLS